MAQPAVPAVAKSGGKVRHPGIAKCSVRESEIVVPSGEVGPSWSRAGGSASTAEMAAYAKSFGAARPGTIWVQGGPKISRQENVEVVNERKREEIMRDLDDGRGSPSQVLEFIQGLRERMQRQFEHCVPSSE